MIWTTKSDLQQIFVLNRLRDPLGGRFRELALPRADSEIRQGPMQVFD